MDDLWNRKIWEIIGIFQIANFWIYPNCKFFGIFKLEILGIFQIRNFWNFSSWKFLVIFQIATFCNFPNWKFLEFSELQIFWTLFTNFYCSKFWPSLDRFWWNLKGLCKKVLSSGPGELFCRKKNVLLFTKNWWKMGSKFSKKFQTLAIWWFSKL